MTAPRHRPAPPGHPLEGAPLRGGRRAPQDRRVQGPTRQRPPVRGDRGRAPPVPRRLHAPDRHRDPGPGRAMPPGRHRHGPLRRARRRRPSGPSSSSPTSATAAAGWSWRSPRAGSTSRHIIDLVDLTAEFKAAGKTFRVSTKYPALTRAYFRRWGIYYYQLIDSDGALELHPTPGDRRRDRRPDQLGDHAEGQPPPRDRGGDGARVGLVPDRPRAEPPRAGRRGRGRPAGAAARRDGRRARRPTAGSTWKSSAAPAAPGPETAAARRRLPPRPGRPAHRPRRGLGRPGLPRLARHRAWSPPGSSPPASATSSSSAPAGSSASPPASSSTATATRRSTASASG